MPDLAKDDLCKTFLKKKLDKSNYVRMSDWSCDLSERQIAYASADSEASLLLYHSLTSWFNTFLDQRSIFEVLFPENQNLKSFEKVEKNFKKLQNQKFCHIQMCYGALFRFILPFNRKASFNEEYHQTPGTYRKFEKINSRKCSTDTMSAY